MKIFKSFLVLLTVTGILSACQQEVQYLGIPRLAISEKAMEFEIPGGAQDLELRHLHFHLAGLHVRVDHAAGARLQNAPDRQNVFRTDRACAVEVLLAQSRGVEYDLHQTRAVTKLHKDQRAEIAADIRPAHQRDFPADVFLAELRAVARAFPSA